MGTKLQSQNVLDELTLISEQYHGDHSLDAVSGAGCIYKPRIALVFINPTHRNISTSKTWRGLKAPWIGCNNIWKLFLDAGLIEPEIYKEISEIGKNWSEEFSEIVYSHVRNKGLYITNIVKWAGLDAALPEKDKIKIYLPLLLKELKEIKAQKVVLFGQLTFDAVMKSQNIKAHSFKYLNESAIENNKIIYVDSAYGRLVPCYFPVGQGIKNYPKAVGILQLVNRDKEYKLYPVSENVIAKGTTK